jgi:DNA-binding response OmpR family regulator
MTPATIKKRILVVEDNQDIREAIVETLTSEGYDMEVAKDGEEALELISAQRFDLVLLDLMMPGISGMEVLTKIRSFEDPQINNLPVVIVTAKFLIDDIDAVLPSGATTYLLKPFRAAALRTKILNIFEGRDGELVNHEKTK